MQPNIVARPELAAEGKQKIDWVRRNITTAEYVRTFSPQSFATSVFPHISAWKPARCRPTR